MEDDGGMGGGDEGDEFSRRIDLEGSVDHPGEMSRRQVDL